MKTIQAINVWVNGANKEAKILNAYATNVTLNTSATFYYALLAENQDGTQGEQLTQGELVMTGEDYEEWTVDNYAWDWISEQLNLTTTGDYVSPVSTL